MLALDFSFFFGFVFVFFTLNLLLAISALDHFIVLLVFLDLLLLTSLLVFIVFTLLTNSYEGYTYAILVFAVAAADTAVGLGLFILYYKTTGSVSINDNKKISERYQSSAKWVGL